MPDFVVRLGEDQKKWNKWLRSMGLPQEKGSTKEVLENALLPLDAKHALQVVGDFLGDRSFTQSTNNWISPRQAVDADGNEALPDQWVRYLEYMSAIAELASPEDNGTAWKEFFLEDAWSRRSEPPIEMPAETGTPAEFRELLSRYKIEIHRISDRRHHTIEVRAYSLG